MSNAELTTLTQQLIAQVASDHAWFSSITDDMNDHADRLNRHAMVSATNQVEVKATQVESQRLFGMIDLKDQRSGSSARPGAAVDHGADCGTPQS